MEFQKLYDEDELIEDPIQVGLLRLVNHIPDYSFFYHLNSFADLSFRRIDDLIVEGKYYTYRFPRFQTYLKTSKACITYISNISTESIEKNNPTELFVEEYDVKLLLNNYPDVDYILTSTEEYPDFSVILHPDNLAFAVEDYTVSSDEELYLILEYYD